ncbi:MAG: LysR substrate-binding domain-containing protein [Oceanospirillaceae bacterium]
MRRMIPSTMALQCFEAAARNASFNQAAREMSLSQGAISRQIKLLEEYLEHELFIRIKQRVVLTEAGHLYFDEISTLLQSLEASTIKIKSFNQLTGSLNVGCYPTLGTRWLLPYLLRFGNSKSAFSVNSITYQDNTQLDENLIDIGIIHGDPPFKGLHAQWLMPDDMVAVASPSLIPSPLEDLLELFEHRHIFHVTRPQSWRIWLDGQNRQDIKLQGGGLSFPQFDMVIEATIAGYGIGLLPLILIEKELKNGTLILAHPHISRTDSAYYLVTPVKKSAIPKINMFRDWLIKEVSS